MPMKGYGFLDPEDGSAHVFCHLTVVGASGRATLPQGAALAWEIVKGDTATQVLHAEVPQGPAALRLARRGSSSSRATRLPRCCGYFRPRCLPLNPTRGPRPALRRPSPQRPPKTSGPNRSTPPRHHFKHQNFTEDARPRRRRPNRSTPRKHIISSRRTRTFTEAEHRELAVCPTLGWISFRIAR